MNFPGHFEENLDTGTKLLFPGQSRETRDGWQVAMYYMACHVVNCFLNVVVPVSNVQ